MSEEIPVLEGAAWEAALARSRQPFHAHYFAMYSSVLGGIVTDPLRMTVPADDHMVHRGDGVFEACKCVAGNLYNFHAHRERLEFSARAIGLAMPVAGVELTALVARTARAGGRPDCVVRVFVSRGPGSFGVNPRDCPRPQLYVVITKMDPPFMQKNPAGARVRTSTVPLKPGFMATTKSCNYLSNVLMKMEAVDAGVDYTLAYDERGFMAEGATENFAIVSREGDLLFPRLDRILAGTTMLRVAELAQALTKDGTLRRVAFEDVPPDAVRRARELLAIGTTPNVASAVEYDGAPVGDGRPGPVAKRLDELLAADMRGNRSLLIPVGL